MHKQHLPSLLTGAAGFTSPGSPMIAGSVRCQSNALVKNTNATLGCIQEGISNCKGLTALHKELVSSPPLKPSEHSPSPESRMKNLDRCKEGQLRQEGWEVKARERRDELFNMEKSLGEKKKVFATGDCWH